MQAEILGSNDIEGLTADNLIPVEFLFRDDSQRSRSQDALSIVELGKQLLLSAKHGETETVRDLMCRGAPFTTDWLGTSALHLAAQSNHVDTAEVLLRAGISRDARTKVDRTPLHMAAYEGHHEMAVLLLNYGADVDSRDMLRMTPLHWAVEREHEEVMHVLLDNGADANAISKFDKTPISLALEHDRLDLVDILQQERDVLSLREEKQRQANTAEIEEATHSLMQMQEAERKQEQQQQQLEMQQQLQQKRKIQQGPPMKKPKILFQPIHVSPSSDDDQEKEAELAARISSIENSTFKKRKELGGLSGLEQPLRLLEAHGITMIPVDNDASIVENAMESGRTVVLTEAGKLALNLTRNPSMSGKKLQDVQIGGTTYKARRKVIAIRADQILNKTQPALTPKGPNILKRNTPDKAGKLFLTQIPNNPNNSSNVMTTKAPLAPKVQRKMPESPAKEKNPILLKLDDEIEEIEEETPTETPDDQVMDIALLNKQLIEARRLADEYRKQLQKKEEEAEIYKQQLKNMTAQTIAK